MSKIHENYTIQVVTDSSVPQIEAKYMLSKMPDTMANFTIFVGERIRGVINTDNRINFLPSRVKISPPPSARYRIKTRFYRVAIRCRCFVHSSKLDREYLCNYKRIEIKKKNKKTKKEKRRNEGESGHGREQISSIGRFTQKPGIFMQQRRYGEWKNRLDGILFCYEAGPTYLFRTANRFKLATRVPLEPIFPCPPFAL